MCIRDRWKQYDVTQHPAFSPFLTEENVKFRFYFREDSSGFGNRLFIDEVNFTSPVGVNEFVKQISFNVYPNPGNEKATVSFVLSEPGKVSVSMRNILGETILAMDHKETRTGKTIVDLNMDSNIPSGVYFICVEYNGFTAVRKWIFEKN